jgi:predicted porin
MRSALAQTNFKGDFGMQKKLLAVAVAGALAAPAVALAQTSTVQIYGAANFEYGSGDQGAGRPNVDYLDNPGGSNIGFKGEEKLGGNLSAWFQCETSADTRGVDNVGLCSRNSAIGLKGGFGNVWAGKWDTPMKRALNQGTVGAIRETGLLGTSFMAFGGSGGADFSGTGSDPVNRHRWKRRESNNMLYESPNFGGFVFAASVSAANRTGDLPVADGDPNPKPRVWSVAGLYNAGPLAVGLGYERHVDAGAHQGAAASCGLTSTAPGAITCTASTVPTVGLDDDAWGFSISYVFMGKLKVGFTYLDADYETGVGASMSKKTWSLGGDWNISGPHTVKAQYVKADDTKGNSTTSIGGNGGITSPGTLVGGVFTPRAGGTGGDQWTISYQYALSKRTWVGFGYNRIDNDSATAAYRIGNTGAHTVTGQNVDAWAIEMSHRF